MRLCSSRNLVLVSLLIARPPLLPAQVAPANVAANSQQPSLPDALQQQLILLPLLVTDFNGRVVTSLTQANFRVTEDGRPQAIRSVSLNHVPDSVGILMDLSGSMVKGLPLERAAVLGFLRASNPQDEYFLIGFSDAPELLVDFTSSKGAIASGLDVVPPAHRTALYDAVLSGLQKLQEARNPRKVLLVVSDGGENQSHHSEAEVRLALRKSQIQVDAVAIADSWSALNIEERRDRGQRLNNLSNDSGGRFFPLEDPSQAGLIGEAMASELRHGYLLTYASDSPNRDGKWRKVKVKASPPPGMSHLTVHARAGYYAPLQ
jgi:Ca-activated chloride channel homolog